MTNFKLKRPLLTVLTAIALFSVLACTPAQGDAATEAGKETPVIDHVVQSLKGEAVNLADFRGKALLIVNTASKCGFTPQYADLQALYEKYSEQGLVVIGFPSNDFGGQEPGDADQIENFCRTNYGVTFPMMAKVHAKGSDMAPIYKTLTEETSGDLRGEVKWNFTKFLVDPEGKVVQRFGSRVKPMSDELTQAVEAVLPD